MPGTNVQGCPDFKSGGIRTAIPSRQAPSDGGSILGGWAAWRLCISDVTWSSSIGIVSRDECENTLLRDTNGKSHFQDCSIGYCRFEKLGPGADANFWT